MHPKCSVQLASGGTTVISSTPVKNLPLLASALSAITSPPHSSCLTPTMPPPDALPIAQTAPAICSIMDEQDHSPSSIDGWDNSVNLLATALDHLSTNDPVQSPGAPSPLAPTPISFPSIWAFVYQCTHTHSTLLMPKKILLCYYQKVLWCFSTTVCFLVWLSKMEEKVDGSGGGNENQKKKKVEEACN